MGKISCENVVKIVPPSRLSADLVGDFVKCIECERLSLLAHGSESCLWCGSKNTVWADEDNQEISVSDLEQQGYKTIQFHSLPVAEIIF